MALWNLKAELIDIIEFLDDTRDTLSWRFERHDNEIKNGAKLVVREGQLACFVNEGALADVFEPGTYTLETKNLPILSTLKGWKYGFDSPFKAEVYFITSRQVTDMKWGTQAPFMYPSERFGPVDLRGFGSYSMKITDAGKFLKEIVGTSQTYSKDEFSGFLRSMVVTRAIDAISESGQPLEKIAVNQNELSELCQEKLSQEFGEYGLEMSKFLIESITMPDEEKKQIYEYIRMEKIDMSKYQQKAAADAMKTAAGNEGGGLAGAGMGMGMGMAMGGQMGNMMNQSVAQPQQQQQQQSTPPPPPPTPPQLTFHAVINGTQSGPFDLNTLKQMATSGQLTKESLVWREGMANWTAAGEVNEVSGVFGSVPPPLPPQ